MIVKFGHTTSSYVNDVFLQKYAINKTGKFRTVVVTQRGFKFLELLILNIYG